MTAPHPTEDHADQATSARLIRAAIWVAIGALIAAAFVCVVWVFVGSGNGIIGRAFLTILLLAGFSGAALLDAHLAPRRPAWFALASMGVWVITLLLGATMIWMPERLPFSGLGRFVQFLLIVLVLQLALLHVRLFTKALQRNRTTFTLVVYIVTVVLVVALTILVVLPLAFHEYIVFASLYWRFVVATTILAAVGTALLPLVNALFAPRAPRPRPTPAAWPTYVDGRTPLPVLIDGTPDWNAYYTGYPTQPYAQQPAPEADATPRAYEPVPTHAPQDAPRPSPARSATTGARATHASSSGTEDTSAPAVAAAADAPPAPASSEAAGSLPAAGHAARQQPTPEMPWGAGGMTAGGPQRARRAGGDTDEGQSSAPTAPGYEGYPPPPPLPPRP
ncbi:hypothetical protein [Microbacterium xanthum]|uniref:hypothetical protein n=1 Tax=Microbacterium xanthum TaxID=3079794 RepID=UPI002AD26CB8|nr:hypothetical protein [Microbacterium sp. KSW-48]MDZ8171780.1 hypothetical protein [Microbacterium sp. KSW-48]